jgi:hypothetical protein
MNNKVLNATVDNNSTLLNSLKIMSIEIQRFGSEFG